METISASGIPSGLPRPPVLDLRVLEAGWEDEDEEQSKQKDAELEECLTALAANPSSFMTDDVAQKLWEHDQRLALAIERERTRRRQLRALLSACQKKEEELVDQMDAHMDEVEHREKALSKKIEDLTSQNQVLRELHDQRVSETLQQVERLNEATKQCSDSETRVQFLVDRIVALLRQHLADPEQVEQVVKLRQRERDLIRQLEETRQQHDEVRQQNGELTSRLTEELSLSRRLSDQLAEVEERFFQRRRSGKAAAEGLSSSSTAPDDPNSHGADPRAKHWGNAEPELSGGSVSSRSGPMARRTNPPLRAVPESEAGPNWHDSDDAGARVPRSTGGSGRQQPDRRPSARSDHGHQNGVGDVVQIMEQKLKEALDWASFECPVLRLETGVYSFGSLKALVILTDEGHVEASVDGTTFQPIDVFLQQATMKSQQQEYDSLPLDEREAQ